MWTRNEDLKVLGACVSVQSCVTLCETMDCSPSGSSVHGIVQARILEWVAMPSFRVSSQPRDWTHIPWVSCTAGRFFTPEQLGKLLKRFQFSSVVQSCPTLCDPMNCSTPGLPVHHKLLEFTQTHAHRVGDAIQPSHPLLSPSPPAPSPSQHQGLFQRVNSSHEVAKVLEFQLQHQSFQWTTRNYLLQDGLIGSPCSPRDCQESSSTPQFKSINFLVLSFLYSPTLTSIHEHWKNHSLDQTNLCWPSNVSAF